ncbi:hypothetical protein U1Q18_032955, partial [Sarracenia purpurea var. burkii]
RFNSCGFTSSSKLHLKSVAYGDPRIPKSKELSHVLKGHNATRKGTLRDGQFSDDSAPTTSRGKTKITMGPVGVCLENTKIIRNCDARIKVKVSCVAKRMKMISPGFGMKVNNLSSFLREEEGEMGLIMRRL